MFPRLPATLLFIILLLSGCTWASLGGRFADWYAMKKIDDHFDLTKEQDQYLEPRVEKHIQWIKTVEVPVLGRDLEELIKRVEEGIEAEDLAWVDGQFNGLKQRLDERLRKDAVWLLSRLESSQIEHMQEKIAKRKKDWEERVSEGPDKYRESRLERYEENFEEWFGSITDQQRTALLAMYSDYADIESGELYHTGWLESQSKFIESISPPADVARIESFLTEWLRDPALLRTGDRKAHYQSRIRHVRETFLEIDKMISDEQRAHLIKKLHDMRNDLLAFAK